MRKEEFVRYLEQRGSSPDEREAAIAAIGEFEEFLLRRSETLESATTEAISDYVSELIDKGQNSIECLLALARYAYLINNHALYVYLVGVVGGYTVLPSLAARTAEIAGEATRDTVFAGLKIPPLGSAQNRYPGVTQEMIDRLRSCLPEETCKDILAGNHHQVPVEKFEAYHQAYRESGVDGLLRFRHESLVSDLQAHARNGKPWYEQKITPEVVEFVRRNPEIQAGVRDGNSIFVTKIPYAPTEYLRETDPVLKRYHMCHCPLARASILDESTPVSPLFCYCSGGYEKLAFDVVFGEPVRVTVVNSALAGDLVCRFRIDIPTDVGVR